MNDPAASRLPEPRTALLRMDEYAASERLSDVDRELVVDRLREHAVQGRLSHDTFLRRMELAFAARSRHELDELTADLPTEGRLTRALARAVGTLATLKVRLDNAWRTPQLPALPLPRDPAGPVKIGRLAGCDLKLGDESVSRVHAELRLEGGVWLLRDLGSTNGTQVNGWRVIGTVPVRAGDRVSFGSVSFRLALASAQTARA
ncbi:peptide-binding protein [Streptacidiphilus pinicola]|uniref:Peptide-binding protein n=2 Tax=Streptacidiphilus pinicola TaxID=2219663 RepID=A0A2X0IF49_9ACTN|nr:peptide-binding protein [Streptacidiphilus pinicola]